MPSYRSPARSAPRAASTLQPSTGPTGWPALLYGSVYSSGSLAIPPSPSSLLKATAGTRSHGNMVALPSRADYRTVVKSNQQYSTLGYIIVGSIAPSQRLEQLQNQPAMRVA